MVKFMTSLFLSCVILILSAAAAAQNCSEYLFSLGKNFATCRTLPVLNSFLHWNYYQSNHTAEIAYRHAGVSTSQWVAWALNLERQGMTKAQSLVAFTNTSGNIHAYTAPIADTRTTLAQGPLSFNVRFLTAEYKKNQMIIFATLDLPRGRTTFNQVWQIGPLFGNNPGRHSMDKANWAAKGSVDFLSGSVVSGGTLGQRKRNVHGVMNAVSWGILMPVGAIVARYMRVFNSADPAWFYLHVACQCSAYIVGVAGWGTGLKLGSDSLGIQHYTHRNIGITLFCLGTLQIFALPLRPKKDHKYRLFWNIYHHSIGYSVIILSIVNIFEGFKILQPVEGWKWAYIGVLIFWGAVAFLLEVFTWYVVMKKRFLVRRYS